MKAKNVISERIQTHHVETAGIWSNLCRKKQDKNNLLTSIHILEFLPQLSWSETVLIKSIIPVNTIKDL